MTKPQAQVAWLHKPRETLTWALFERLGSGEFYIVQFDTGVAIYRARLTEKPAKELWERLSREGWLREIPKSAAVDQLRIH